MQLDVKHDSANHRPPRIQSVLRQDETRRQVNDMLTHNVIRQSATGLKSYSQVLLTPKPNGPYQLCIDFRNLNVVTKAAIWHTNYN